MIKKLIFIDNRVADYQTLLVDLMSDTEWLILDAESDGVLQMQAALAGYRDLDSIQIISHGSTGTLYLGSTMLTQGNLDSYQTQWQAMGSSLTATGDILLYGCNVGDGAVGQAFVQAVAVATRADVAASTNATGAAALGGDWVLEQTSGVVEAAGLHTDSFAGLLGANTAPTFAAGTGKVTTDLAALGIDGFDEFKGGTGAALEIDGMIWVAGYIYNNGSASVIRYNVDGTLDYSFGGHGRLFPEFGGTADYIDPILTDDGVLFATTRNGNLVLARYKVDGTLDTTFDSDGTLTGSMSFRVEREMGLTV